MSGLALQGSSLRPRTPRTWSSRTSLAARPTRSWEGTPLPRPASGSLVFWESDLPFPFFPGIRIFLENFRKFRETVGFRTERWLERMESESTLRAPKMSGFPFPFWCPWKNHPKSMPFKKDTPQSGWKAGRPPLYASHVLYPSGESQSKPGTKMVYCQETISKPRPRLKVSPFPPQVPTNTKVKGQQDFQKNTYPIICEPSSKPPG